MDSPIFKLPFQTAEEELQLDLAEAWWDGWEAGRDRQPRRDEPRDRLSPRDDVRLPLMPPPKAGLVDVERTTPSPSRWDQDGAEYVRSNEEWLARCASAMVKRWREVSLDQAFAVAREFSLNDELRALAPERAAESIMAG